MEARRRKSEAEFGDSRLFGVLREIIRDPLWLEHFNVSSIKLYKLNVWATYQGKDLR